jgi:rhodanese-related sulfurtransferase
VVKVFLKPSELAELLGRSMVVDLRRYPDYRSEHIPNAVSVPFHYFSTLKGLALYPPLDEDLGGARVLEGGFEGWRKHGFSCGG